ncbi:universal stress protein [Salinicola avicenniae]|uniref:universal stress protein n=1 Tax=Salinicola avicenniae TaxID=2916836 RepID=UPI002074A639|nr:MULTISPECIES: universal stress protein [unclassified Salinicola]
MTQHILVPIDGSESAQRALEHACLMQRVLEAKLYLLHIPEVPQATDYIGARVGAPPLDYNPTKGREEGEALLEAAWQAAGGSGDVEYHVAEGRPAQVIVAQVENLGIDTIVMGSRGLSDLKGLAVGSVSHKVSHVAPCPVITLHVPD